MADLHEALESEIVKDPPGWSYGFGFQDGVMWALSNPAATQSLLMLWGAKIRPTNPNDEDAAMAAKMSQGILTVRARAAVALVGLRAMEIFQKRGSDPVKWSKDPPVAEIASIESSV